MKFVILILVLMIVVVEMRRSRSRHGPRRKPSARERKPRPPVSKCGRQKVWKTCASECDQICAKNIRNIQCPKRCAARCECPNDKIVWHNGRCITKTRCPGYAREQKQKMQRLKAKLQKLSNENKGRKSAGKQFKTVCGSERVTIKLMPSLLKGLKAGNFHAGRDASNVKCKPTEKKGVLTFDIKLQECNPTIKQNDKTIQFVYDINQAPFTKGMKGITREQFMEFKSVCEYPRKQAKAVGFQSKFTVAKFISRGKGKLAFTMGLYKDSKRRFALRKGQVMKVNQEVHLDVTLESDNKDLVMGVTSCIAVPYDPNGDGPKSVLEYPFIEDSCIQTDKTFKQDMFSGREYMFAFKTFRFKGGGKQVYLKCEMMVCSNSNPGQCTAPKKCSANGDKKIELGKRMADGVDSNWGAMLNSQRTRRSVESSQMYAVSHGPFYVVEKRMSDPGI